MSRLRDIAAVAHPEGNRIDLSWTNPEPAGRPGMRVVRREVGHPSGPDDGVVVADGTDVSTVTDTGLRGETVYYYSLFPYTGNPPVYDTDPHNRTSATALSPYDFAGLLYRLLPSIYRRYDAALLPAPGSVAPADADQGQLRRFLELPGAELDRLYSLARTLLDATDVDRVEGTLLPLLAQWIGWRTNYALPVEAQRNEIRFAPRVYQTIGGLEAVGATVARVTGWECRTKEYVHNVARTNQPERQNLWWVERDSAGQVTEPRLASVNFAHDGRPVLVRDADGSVFAAYHTRRPAGWDIWAKRHTADGGWEPSVPVTGSPSIDKHPSAALAGPRLWLFWQTYDPADQLAQRHWRISFATRTGTGWSAPAVFGDPATERQLPAAAADGAGGLWLFWRERAAGGWQLRYNRHDGIDWQLATAPVFPPDGPQDPRVEDDLHVLVRPGAADGALWVFWSRQEAGGPPGQTRRSIAYRVKAGPDPAVMDWSPVRTVPKSGDGGYHDRQPYALASAGGTVELLWSTTRDGGPAVVRNTVNPAAFTWGAEEILVAGPYAARGPAAVDLDGTTLVLYRSHRSIAYDAGSLHTLDNRYAGTATADSRWTARLALRGAYEDFQTYVYDAGAGRVRTNDDRVARDTVGLFLTPDVTDPDELRVAIGRLAETLRDFMPATARAVYITP